MKPRTLYRNIWKALSNEKSMVFAAGPRQSGKTTLAQMISEAHANRLYFNWDIPKDRTRLIENPFFFEEVERNDNSKPLIVFDEIQRLKKLSQRRL